MKAQSLDILGMHNVSIIGHGTRPLVFAHGFGCDQTMWNAVAPAFADTHKVVLFDHVGSGQSDSRAFDPERYGSLDGYADDLIRICETLDLHATTFVGHSVSAMIGVLAAIRRPSLFASLVLIGPSPCYTNIGDYHGGFDHQSLDELLDYMDSNFLGWSKTLAATVMGNPDRPELGDALTQSFCRSDPEIARHFARVTFWSDNRADLPHLTIPALILQCADDAIAPDRVGEYVHRKIAGSTLVRLAATGHCPHVSHPEEVIAVLKDFLARPKPEAVDVAA